MRKHHRYQVRDLRGNERYNIYQQRHYALNETATPLIADDYSCTTEPLDSEPPATGSLEATASREFCKLKQELEQELKQEEEHQKKDYKRAINQGSYGGAFIFLVSLGFARTVEYFIHNVLIYPSISDKVGNALVGSIMFGGAIIGFASTASTIYQCGGVRVELENLNRQLQDPKYAELEKIIKA